MNNSAFPTIATTLMLPGPVGQLETLVTPAQAGHRAVAVVCHPHPLQGGTMNNKVVTTTCRAFEQSGISSLRFNYRGVGESNGEYGHFEGEVCDLMAVVDWLMQVANPSHLYLAGFSFGAYIAARGAVALPAVKQLFSIAPAVNHVDFETLTGVACPWLVVQGEEDEVVPPSAVYEWVATMQQHLPTLSLCKLPHTSHFFHRQLLPLRSLLMQHIQSP